MENQLLPFIYAILVFSVVAFLFILLGRIFMNIETYYTYGYEVVLKKEGFLNEVHKIITDRGQKGWRYVRSEEYLELGTDTPMVLLIFEKTVNKVRIF